jgi:hypothetical protein
MPEVITAGISMETTVYCVIILLLLFVCAVMSGSESALFSINPDESNKLKSENSKEAKTIIHLQLCIIYKKTLQTNRYYCTRQRYHRGILFGYKIHETMVLNQFKLINFK